MSTQLGLARVLVAAAEVLLDKVVVVVVVVEPMKSLKCFAENMLREK